MARRNRLAQTMRIDTLSESGAGLPVDEEQSARAVRGDSDMVAGTPGQAVAAAADDRYHQLLNNVYDAVLIVTMSGVIVETNPRASEFLLFDRSELHGMSVVNVIFRADETLLSTIIESLADRRYVLISGECIRKDGSKFFAEIAVSVIHCGNEDQLCFFIRDITVRKQTEKVLKETLQQLQDRDKARSLFVSNVSHELRTPLTSIIYGISNLLKGLAGPLAEKARQYLEMAQDDCKRLLGTVNDILDLSQIETGRLELSKVKVSLARLVARSVESFEPLAQHKGVELRPVDARLPGFVYCDPQEMERVFWNVIGNAIKYTPTGGRVEIKVEEHPVRQRIHVVKVTDTGPGIPSYALERIGERYYRVGEHADGSGLGLAIAKEIVERHNGSIEIESPPPGREQGTLVSIGLPACDPPKLLVVDDDAAVREVIQKQLGSYGYDVATAGYAGGGLNHIRDSRADLVIIDLLLPGMDGVEMIVTMRSDERMRGIPVVVVTGTEPDARKKEILGNLSIQILLKPWRETQLINAIEQAFASKSERA